MMITVLAVKRKKGSVGCSPKDAEVFIFDAADVAAHRFVT